MLKVRRSCREKRCVYYRKVGCPRKGKSEISGVKKRKQAWSKIVQNRNTNLENRSTNLVFHPHQHLYYFLHSVAYPF